MTAGTIDLRSDTVTMPTGEMREAMLTCEVGDDVLGEDPTVNRLERVAAGLAGKEAALFVPSGTFANQCAIACHVRSSDEIIASEGSHIVQHEAGATALIARAQLRTVPPSRGSRIDAGVIEGRIRAGRDIHWPRTGLICLEQATAQGEVYEIGELRQIADLAAVHAIPVHIDGARLFNAAVALGVDPAEIAAGCDSICFCLSKGLCAPVGSMLAGSAGFIGRARRMRKLLGGGMRQAGVVAAAGLVALEKMRLRLGDDHRHARLLADLLGAIPGVTVVGEVRINMLFVRIEADGKSESEILDGLKQRGVLTYGPEQGVWRFVTHAGIGEEDVRQAAAALAVCLAPGRAIQTVRRAKGGQPEQGRRNEQ